MEPFKCPFCSGELKLTYRDEFGHRDRFYEVACPTCKWKTYSRSENVKRAWAEAQEFCNKVQQTLIRSWKR